jgi:hypothetical protein
VTRVVSDLGICGSDAAVASAIHNATGVRVRDDPITLDKFLDRSHPRNGGRVSHAGWTLRCGCCSSCIELSGSTDARRSLALMCVKINARIDPRRGHYR